MYSDLFRPSSALIFLVFYSQVEASPAIPLVERDNLVPRDVRSVSPFVNGTTIILPKCNDTGTNIPQCVSGINPVKLINTTGPLLGPDKKLKRQSDESVSSRSQIQPRSPQAPPGRGGGQGGEQQPQSNDELHPERWNVDQAFDLSGFYEPYVDQRNRWVLRNINIRQERTFGFSDISLELGVLPMFYGTNPWHPSDLRHYISPGYIVLPSMLGVFANINRNNRRAGNLNDVRALSDAMSMSSPEAHPDQRIVDIFRGMDNLIGVDLGIQGIRHYGYVFGDQSEFAERDLVELETYLGMETDVFTEGIHLMVPRIARVLAEVYPRSAGRIGREFAIYAYSASATYQQRLQDAIAAHQLAQRTNTQLNVGGQGGQAPAPGQNDQRPPPANAPPPAGLPDSRDIVSGAPPPPHVDTPPSYPLPEEAYPADGTEIPGYTDTETPDSYLMMLDLSLNFGTGH